VRPETRYTTSGATTIAYQVVGDGPLDLVYVAGWFFNPEVLRDFMPIRRYLERLLSFARVISVDKRGFGMSDRLSPSALPTVDERVADIVAVADAEGLGKVAMMGTFEGGTLGLLWAAADPGRVASVVLIDSFARLEWSRSMFGALAQGADDPAVAARRLWESFDGEHSSLWACPDFALTAAQEKQLARAIRLSANPAVIEPWLRLVRQLDARPRLPDIEVPVLAVHRTGDRVLDVSHGRYLAEHLPNATYLEIPGRDHVPWGRDFDLIMAEVEHFLTGRRPGESSRAAMHTVMFTDIVASTPRVVAMGDQAWKALLERHDEISQDLLERFGGRIVKATGDGLLADLPTPSEALQCAQALVAELRAIGLDLRVGVHVGPCEFYGDDLIGLTVNIAARIMAEAEPGEILVSEAVQEQATGPSLTFSSRGHRPLKGVPGQWALFAVV
jgi:class 3 adenylate cyclase